jgi:putative DNA methylase
MTDDAGPMAAVGLSRRSPILAGIDEYAVSDLARRESRNREKHLPPLTTFRWWARRTGAINSAVLQAASALFGERQLNILDPFAGGGTIPLVALRAGHRVHAQDLNPWAVTGMAHMLRLPSAEPLNAGFRKLRELAGPILRTAYSSRSESDDEETILHTYRVAVGRCGSCGMEQRQFPYALLTLLYRKERLRAEAVLACPAGHVFFSKFDGRVTCPTCDRAVLRTQTYTPRRVAKCPACGFLESLSARASRPGWRWEVCLVERSTGSGRSFALPTDDDIRQASEGWKPTVRLGEIPLGSETAVLLRHGYKFWEDLYPDRQRVVTETLLELAVKASDDERVVDALRMAVVGTTEFAGHLSRWDRFYLKCNDATAGHRFNFSTFVPELNVWGVDRLGRGTVSRRIQSMAQASRWMESEVGRPIISVVSPNGSDYIEFVDVDARIVCGDSAKLPGTADSSIDLVLTDPPYHDDVHYGELSLPFRAWAGLPTAALQGEAATNLRTGVNVDQDSYAQSLVRIFNECRRVLKEDGRLIFSYANNEPRAWVALLLALNEAGFFAVSCLSLHSENETDFKKRNVESCVEDLMMELAITDVGDIGVVLGSVADEPFMGQVARLFTRVGHLPPGWAQDALTLLEHVRSSGIRRDHIASSSSAAV